MANRKAPTPQHDCINLRKETEPVSVTTTSRNPSCPPPPPSLRSPLPPLTLRVIDREGSPWFLAKDVCAVLGLNPNKLNGSLQDHMRRLASDEYAAEVVPMLGNHRKAYLLGESGLYALILRSDKPEAGQFRKWVTSVVLPAIRKDGAYVMGEEKVLTGEMSDTEVLSIDGVESNGPRTQWRTLHISHGE